MAMRCLPWPCSIRGFKYALRRSVSSAVRAWRTPPDFVSVSLGEVGWAGIMRAAVHAGISRPAMAGRLRRLVEAADA